VTAPKVGKAGKGGTAGGPGPANPIQGSPIQGELSNGGANAPLARAGALVAAKKFTEGEAEILRALEGAPGDLRALNLLALVRFKLGRLEEAQATYGEIARVTPEDPGAHRNLGLIALKLGRTAQARPALETAVRLAPGDTRAWSYLGYVYAKQGEATESAAAFRRAGQEALALEVEQSAGGQRPAPTAEEEADERSKTTVEERAEDAESRGAVALAPPLPSPVPTAPPPRPEPEREETVVPTPVEALPVPLLAFVLSRLGQGTPPSAPTGALHLRIADEAHVRADAVLAGAGGLTWQPAVRRAQGRLTGEPLGEAKVPFFRLSGAGEVWVAGAGASWLPVALADDVLYVREDRVLAFDGSLSWEAGTVPGAGLRMLQFRGRGTVALELDAAPVAIKVTEERPTLLAAARLVGWVGRLVPHGGAPGAGGPAPFQLACQGEGVVLLDAGGRQR
jgi:uncharacterized protein (AIM24 family)